MEIEWDEAKRLSNLEERGLDFVDAAFIFEGPFTEAEDRRMDYGERRFRALGEVDGQHYIVVYVWRGTCRRIISAWKVNEENRRRYRRLLDGGA